MVEPGRNDSVPVTEMTIVDTFTKLIFAVEEEFNAVERAVIDAFRAVEANVYRDTTAEMGEYLRNLGVREMIHLVALVERQMREHPATIASGTAGSPRGTQRPH